MQTSGVDLLIVGSGPVGASFAREALERCPSSRVLLIDAGPQLSQVPGRHVRNLPLGERERATVASQGRSNGSPYADAVNIVTARPGTHLAEHATMNDGMPGAAMSTCVGGMGVHWTCASPRPGGAECIGFIDTDSWIKNVSRAERLLHVSADALPSNPQSVAIQAALERIFSDSLSGSRSIQPMPLACRRLADGSLHWSASEDILQPVLDDPRLILRGRTLCRQLLLDGDRVTGALLENLATGQTETIDARVVVVACDALRTPQLLWASRIRPRALGHYLNDQPEVFAILTLSDEVAPADMTQRLALARRLNPVDPLVGVTWIPYADSGHPFHGQVMHIDLSPVPSETAQATTKQVIALAWFCPKDVRFDDCVEFSSEESDGFGMPKMRFAYGLSERDQASIARAFGLLGQAIEALGTPVPGSEPRLLPNGSSLHYQGSVRMGESDDGTSVCDSYSQVWGLRNLFVGGNGVIPTATACNTTLMSVALAVRASERVAELLAP